MSGHLASEDGFNDAKVPPPPPHTHIHTHKHTHRPRGSKRPQSSRSLWQLCLGRGTRPVYKEIPSIHMEGLQVYTLVLCILPSFNHSFERVWATCYLYVDPSQCFPQRGVPGCSPPPPPPPPFPNLVTFDVVIGMFNLLWSHGEIISSPPPFFLFYLGETLHHKNKCLTNR